MFELQGDSGVIRQVEGGCEQIGILGVPASVVITVQIGVVTGK